MARTEESEEVLRTEFGVGGPLCLQPQMMTNQPLGKAFQVANAGIILDPLVCTQPEIVLKCNQFQ